MSPATSPDDTMDSTMRLAVDCSVTARTATSLTVRVLWMNSTDSVRNTTLLMPCSLKSRFWSRFQRLARRLNR